MKTTLQTKITYKLKQFSVDPDYAVERTGNYERRDAITSKWEFAKGTTIDGNGNCHSNFSFNVEKQSFVFADYSNRNDGNLIPLYKIMSPALFLYRLIATFFGSPQCYDGYKTIWDYPLRHKGQNKLISFSEWKGAIGFWLPDTDYKKLNADFRNDLIELMNYLVSDECAHPYDNLVAGSVA